MRELSTMWNFVLLLFVFNAPTKWDLVFLIFNFLKIWRAQLTFTVLHWPSRLLLYLKTRSHFVSFAQCKFIISLSQSSRLVRYQACATTRHNDDLPLKRSFAWPLQRSHWSSHGTTPSLSHCKTVWVGQELSFLWQWYPFWRTLIGELSESSPSCIPLYPLS